MYGLLGRKLGHSFSKEYFTDKFSRLNLNDSYVNIELDDVSEIISFVKENKDLKDFLLEKGLINSEGQVIES